jgi:predicted ribosome-associated RNA-binding protein Tma20
MLSMNRHYERPKRRNPDILPRDTVLIVCGGRKTEKLYFDAIKGKRPPKALTVNHCDNKSDPVSVVNKAIRLSDDSVFSHVWCVIDVESDDQAVEIDKTLKIAKENSIKVALSNRCIEYWLLLHYKQFTKNFPNCAGYKSELKKMNNAYEKNSSKVIRKIASMAETAIDNAKKLESKYGWNGDVLTICPSTSVHELIELIIT